MSTDAPTFAITGTDFASIPSRDLDATIAFYRDTLGLENSVTNHEVGFAEFETGNLTLSAMVSEKMGLEFARNPNPLALHVDDVHAARAALEARGVRFRGDVLDTGVCHMAFFADPDGNALMLHHRYAPRYTSS
jgi:predicted enzyme related to lactoylglutathione lyase